jgi:quercetin dioxygenase-like cupin family protein
MNDATPLKVASAEIVLGCAELMPTLDFFTEELGFLIELIFPADDPAVAVVSAYGLRLRLEAGTEHPKGVLRLMCSGLAHDAPNRTVQAPNGTTVELINGDARPPMPHNEARFVLSRGGDGADWGVGRAGMLYRDLIPERQGGRFIASHIRIQEGGPVPDYVHYHKVRFQMIFCYKGWVKVLYEDQGPPMLMQAGDCFLQPPQMRHRVLESSAGCEVVEIGCPAEHETLVDHELELPTPNLRPTRDFGGQRFIFHEAAKTPWGAWREDGFEARDIGIEAATDGLAGVRVARATVAHASYTSNRDAEFQFGFVLTGSAQLECGGVRELLGPADSFVIPGGARHGLSQCSNDFELLDITLPAAI